MRCENKNPSLQILEYSTPRPKFKTQNQFQTPLARNYHAGTSELIPFGANLDFCCNFLAGTSEFCPFGANSDLTCDWIFLDISYWVFLFGFPRWGLLCFPFVGNYIFPRWGFTMILLSWGTASITKRKILPTFPSTQSPTTYIYQT